MRKEEGERKGGRERETENKQSRERENAYLSILSTDWQW